MNTEIIIAFDGGINLKGVYTTQGKYHAGAAQYYKH